MTPDLLWFVLAGFLLGFITSTLWEWFYFRRERLKLTDRRIRELEEKLSRQEEEESTESDTKSDDATREPAWAGRTYRSPGVFLDVEEPSEEEQQDETADQPAAREVAPVVVRRVPTSASASTSDEARKSLATRPMSARTRQEVLAALRRNSEVAERKSSTDDAEHEELADSQEAERHESADETPAYVDLTPEPEATQPAARRVRAWQQDPILTQPSPDHPDNLSKVKGIGDVYRQRLYQAGIYTWHQVATTDEATLRRATSAYPSSNVDEWLPQAQQLAEKNGRTGAIYTGPTPDDLTKILGIGPVSAQSLYHAGICTFEQLASTTPTRLAELFPIAVAGDQPDFAAWIAQATRLADDKHAS